MTTAGWDAPFYDVQPVDAHPRKRTSLVRSLMAGMGGKRSGRFQAASLETRHSAHGRAEAILRARTMARLPRKIHGPDEWKSLPCVVASSEG
jgi:hypothetical protein